MKREFERIVFCYVAGHRGKHPATVPLSPQTIDSSGGYMITRCTTSGSVLLKLLRNTRCDKERMAEHVVVSSCNRGVDFQLAVDLERHSFGMF